MAMESRRPGNDDGYTTRQYSSDGQPRQYAPGAAAASCRTTRRRASARSWCRSSRSPLTRLAIARFPLPRCGKGGSHVEIGDVERVGLDELAARLADAAHQRVEHVGGLVDTGDPALK